MFDHIFDDKFNDIINDIIEHMFDHSISHSNNQFFISLATVDFIGTILATKFWKPKGGVKVSILLYRGEHNTLPHKTTQNIKKP